MNFISKLAKFNPSKNILNSIRNVSTSNYLKDVQDNNKQSNCCPPCPPCSMYFKEVECKVNEQIALEFVAFYNYLGIFNHFGRSDIALNGCKHFFLKCAEEEKKHALKLCNYQNMRGGTVNLMDVEKPIKSFCTVKDAFIYSLQMEKKITEKLIDLKNVAKKCDDCVTHDLIVNEFIKHQYKSIQSLNGYLKKLELLKDNCSGIYHFDKELQENFGCFEGH
ncbi:soma ferritin-like [Chironomus tepperi]|uniref:soma ferritin-like n=1 Tax=Chironomus tepperi TaxID=113505 RepID=UPI00391EE747